MLPDRVSRALKNREHHQYSDQPVHPNRLIKVFSPEFSLFAVYVPTGSLLLMRTGKSLTREWDAHADL